MSKYTYKELIVEIRGKIGIIYLNRPAALNAFDHTVKVEIVQALRELDEHPDTIFTVLTGKGRFFCAGADVRIGVPTATKGGSGNSEMTDAQKKMASTELFAWALEMMRSIIDHKKVFVLALNGPSVGGGAAWFQGAADLVYAAKGAWLQVTFNALGLVPENGCINMYAQHIGVRRANEFVMFGRKVTVEEFEQWGLVNRVLPTENFHEEVIALLEEQAKLQDGRSLLESKRLASKPLRAGRMLAVYDSFEALSERSVDGASARLFEAKIKELEEKSKKKSKI